MDIRSVCSNESIAKLALEFGCVILCEVPDSCSANMRKMKETAARLPDNIWYSCRQGCAAHQLHRVAVTAADEDTFIGDMHALSSVMRSTTYKGRIVTALREIVSSDLRIVPTPPQSENSAHLQAVLNVFHFREQKHTRGRLLHGENLWSDAKFDEMEKKEQAFTAIINGEH